MSNIKDYQEILKSLDNVEEMYFGDIRGRKPYVSKDGKLGIDKPSSDFGEITHFVPFDNPEEAKIIYNGISAIRNYLKRLEIIECQTKIYYLNNEEDIKYI